LKSSAPTVPRRHQSRTHHATLHSSSAEIGPRQWHAAPRLPWQMAVRRPGRSGPGLPPGGHCHSQSLRRCL
ncbi:hypothetical protein E4U53_000119, partial [Claviceps sorghi]